MPECRSSCLAPDLTRAARAGEKGRERGSTGCRGGAPLKTHTPRELGTQHPGTPEDSPVAPSSRNRSHLDSTREVCILFEELANIKHTLVTSPSTAYPTSSIKCLVIAHEATQMAGEPEG